jgi:hypothetical protein
LGVLAIRGAIAGVGAPPAALGFLLERIVRSLVALFGRDPWGRPAAKALKNSLVAALAERRSGARGDACKAKPDALLRLFFYASANQQLIDTHLGSRTQMYASWTSALAIGLGLLLSLALDAWSWLVAGIPLVLMVALGFHALYTERRREEMLAAWVATLGAKAVEDFASGLARQT